MFEQKLKESYQKLNEHCTPSPELLEQTRLLLAEPLQEQPKQTPRRIWQYSAVAACAVLLTASLIALPQLQPGNGHAGTSSGQRILLAEQPTSSAALSEEGSTPQRQLSDNAAVIPDYDNPGHVPSKKVCYLNELDSISHAGNLPFHGPATHRYVRQNEQEVFAYLGTEIKPELPAGMTAWTGEKSWQFIYTKATDEVFYDGCSFVYADQFDDSGYPTANAKELTVFVSKKGYRCGIHYCGETPEVTNTYGTAVTFGKDKNEPVYTAEFQKDGVQYTVTGRNLELLELYQAVKSLITA